MERQGRTAGPATGSDEIGLRLVQAFYGERAMQRLGVAT